MAWKKKQNEAKEVDGLLRQLAGKEEAAKSVRGNDVTENDEVKRVSYDFLACVCCY